VGKFQWQLHEEGDALTCKSQHHYLCDASEEVCTVAGSDDSAPCSYIKLGKKKATAQA